MTPITLRIKNFRSFKGEQTFHFPGKPGLYFMQGVNEVEPRLGANGAGKTSVWEALFWASYGVTTDGLKAGDVCNWEVSKGVEVEFVYLSAQGEPRRLRRTWGPISWTLSHGSDDPDVVGVVDVDLTKGETNAYLADLRLELEPFLNSILTAQGQPMFLDLKQEPQAALFSSVLGLERWMDYSKAASKKAQDQDAKSRELERQCSRLQGELVSVERVDTSTSHDDWEIANAKKVLALGAEHKDGMARRDRLKRELREAQELEADCRARVAKAQPSPGLVKDVGVFAGYVADYSQMLRDARHDLTNAQDSHKHLLAGSCPTCGQSLESGDGHAKAARRVEKLQSEVKRWGRELGGAEERLSELQKDLAAQQSELDAAKDALADAGRGTADARRALDLLDRTLDRIEDEAEALAKQENPFAKMARDAARDADRLRKELGEAQGRLDASNARYGLFSYWVRGFKEIRLQEIASALAELEIEVNSAVTELGLLGWELRFAVDKEGKGGGIQRGFTVTVKSPHHPEPTPWRSWSGGEKQRLRLAANMGLADLIRNRTGATLNLEVWDEPTNGLSPEGWRDLFESLAQRAAAEARVIFITDHKAHDYGGFAGVATVVKTPSGSRVRTSWGRV